MTNIKKTEDIVKQNHESNNINENNTKPKIKRKRHKYKYIKLGYNIKDKNKNEQTVLNQFICLECNKVNLIEEILKQKTSLYEEKDLPCRCCKKETTQICVRDKTIRKAELELSTTRNEQENKAFAAIMGRTKKCIKENVRSKPKQLKKYSKERIVK